MVKIFDHDLFDHVQVVYHQVGSAKVDVSHHWQLLVLLID